MESHAENLERVLVSIAPVVLAFCREIVRQGRPSFHMQELTAYVRRCVGETAPDSAGRILRELRQRKQLDYQLVSRRDSHYLIKSIAS
jgi:hypothetical protein